MSPLACEASAEYSHFSTGRKARDVILRPLVILIILFRAVLGFSPAVLELVHTNAIALTSQATIQSHSGPASASGENTRHQDIENTVELLRLYYVSDGRLYTRTLGKEDIKTREQLKVNGYVCGIIVLCDGETAVSVDGRALSKIRRNADGTFSLKNFRDLMPDELALPNSSQAYYRPLVRARATQDNESTLPGAYSFFPRITGDTISQDATFTITFERGRKTTAVAIQQSDCYYAWRTVSLDPAAQGSSVAFRYLGSDPKRITEQPPDVEARLQAIADGINSVEATFGMKLVNNVNIINFEDIDDAVSCDERDDVWFYVDAFRDEPLNELKTMAAHETLHIFVDRNNLARDSGVRKLFAYLKGYDDLSYERFMIVMSGDIPPDRASQANTDNVFLAFINEMNFLEGTKGGHPQNDMDEFCVSFMHSLMFINRLKQNLDRPLTFPGPEGATRCLTTEEKASALDTYVKALETLIRAIPETERSGKSTRRAKVFLESNLKKAKDIRETWRVGT